MKHCKHLLIASTLFAFACGDDGGGTETTDTGSDSGTETSAGPGGSEEGSTGNGTEEGTETGSTGTEESTGNGTDTGDGSSGSDGSGSGSGSESGSGSTGEVACDGVDNQEECEGAGCIWGPPNAPMCVSPEEGCPNVPPEFCAAVPACMLDGEDCVPAR